MVIKKTKYLIYIILLIFLGLTVNLGISQYIKYNTSVPESSAFSAEEQFAKDSKTEVDVNSFTRNLPFSSKNFDIYYNSTKKEIRVILKNKGLSFQETKSKNEILVNNFLKNIGAYGYYKTVWLMEK